MVLPRLVNAINTLKYKEDHTQQNGPYFIDLEAFQHGHKTIIKELCILDIHRPLRPLYFLFTPPQIWQTLSAAELDSYDYQERHIHQLLWGEGKSRYCRKCVYHHIKENFPACENAIFYVMVVKNVKC